MNLKILDAKKDYRGISLRFPNNFYMTLAEKIVARLTAVNLSNKTDVTVKINGNPIRFIVGPDGIKVVVDKKTYSAMDSKLPSLEKLIYQIYQDDLHDVISVDHGNGSVVSDRADFNKVPGTVFTKLYKTVKFDKSGRMNSEVSNSRSSAPVLTEKQFENATKLVHLKQTTLARLKVYLII